MGFDEGMIAELMVDCGFEVRARALIPGRAAQFKPAPAEMDSKVRELLTARHPEGLFTHQSDAITAVLEGRDVCLATPTASGKSLVFITAAADLLLKDPSARVLALYPARALIQDQLMKWSETLQPLALQHTFIDGGVPVPERLDRLERCQVALLTPDVAHAWMMSNLQEPVIREFLRRTRLLVLDEAHVYEGAFGTNMAFFLRRLGVAVGPHQLVCSTATLGRPADYVERLIGRSPVVFGPAEDRSPIPPKAVLHANVAEGRAFDNTVNFLKRCAEVGAGRFLAFGDSRKAVERIVASCLREYAEELQEEGEEEEEEEDLVSVDELPAESQEVEAEEELVEPESGPILPYRAGYETEDRTAIQKALTSGELVGVVATSALELGVDIGEIDLVILLSVPPSVKAFWQRIGRAGRKSPGVCVIIDSREAMEATDSGLRDYMARPMEPNWLYLENRYIQYTNALCATIELAQLGQATTRRPSSRCQSNSSTPSRMR